MKDSIDCTVLIMTYNEEANIHKCLESVAMEFERVCVVDSFSSDGTLDVVQKRFPGVDIYRNEFTSWADQRNWLFREAAVDTNYTLFLDADESVSPALAAEIKSLCNAGDFDTGVFSVDNFFLGRHIQFAYGHPKIKRLFRSSEMPLFQSSGAREYVESVGYVVEFNTPIHHEDRKSLQFMFQKQINNAAREVQSVPQSKGSSHEPRLKRLMRESVWSRLPRFLRPFIYFFYRYVLRLGFLDGAPGFIFCFFQSLAYQVMISTLEYERGVSSSQSQTNR